MLLEKLKWVNPLKCSSRTEEAPPINEAKQVVVSNSAEEVVYGNAATEVELGKTAEEIVLSRSAEEVEIHGKSDEKLGSVIMLGKLNSIGLIS